MDKTYAETVGETPFDWFKWLISCEEKEPSLEDHSAKIELAKNWTTCACGNMCAIIPRGDDGSKASKGYPLDSALMELGYEFYAAVKCGQWNDAKDTLAQIENRSSILIHQELQKLNALPAVQL